MPASREPLCLLTRRTLPMVRGGVSVPTYDARDLTAGVVHFGLGRFHRSHQASYFDRLAEEGVSSAWGSVGASLRTAGTKQALSNQDGLHTVFERGDTDARLRVVGSLKRCLFGPRQERLLLEALTHPGTKLVSLTVTAPTYQTQSPRELGDGVFGYLAAALQRRHADGTPPFTVMSCDNVPENGNAARRQVLAAAELVDRGLARWIDAHVAFPNSMVDRITPPLGAELRDEVAARLGLRDECAVVTESFSQWVVEDRFCNTRPPLDAVGVQFVADAAPYREVKSRLLNASHCALGYLGTAAGLSTTAEAMRDPALAGFVRTMMREEVAPRVSTPAGLNVCHYQDQVVRRLASTALADPLTRLCARGSVRIPAYVLPSVEAAVRASAPRRRLTLVVAAWIATLRREGAARAGQDPGADMLQALVRHHPNDVRPLLRHGALFGGLGQSEAWAAELQATLVHLETYGVRAALAAASHPHWTGLHGGSHTQGVSDAAVS
ncbi:mannitol dehydrogenase family protein [Pedococcus sp. 5OH_020]|uniref:mannitol dehydrogenase family protein n=1 Tax=Pedococcus sp. 5OH_020 TaxID=2989814 RepID=UPI0022EA08BD|nr:mannitol dehydrogenase family protein [Pedococcus sp. 5OH_020]